MRQERDAIAITGIYEFFVCSDKISNESISLVQQKAIIGEWIKKELVISIDIIYQRNV